jgi:hypothetical protein
MTDTTDLKEAGNRAAEQALALVRERFEGGRHPNHMHYHNTIHTRGVIDKAMQIGEALGMSERELLLTQIAAAFHDSVQEWQAVSKDGGVVNRVRFAGANEVASAKEATDCMGNLGVPFTPEEKGIVATAILATIPGWGVPYSTVIQPFLKPDSHKVVRAVALADLGSSGMDPEMFLTDGPTLFAEENMDVIEALESARTGGDIPADKQESYKARYVGWLKIQPGFARGRQRYFAEVESASVDDESKQRLQALFSRYDESIAAAEESLARAETMDFVPLMRQLHASAFPDEPGGTQIARPSQPAAH